MIPEAKKNAVKHALHAAFGVSEFEGISELTVGLSSALIFRIVVRGKPYLLRIITRTDAMGDPTHYYGCMKAGAEAGLAPRVWYMGIDDRISITDFVEAKPLPIHEARVKLSDLLKRLHSLPPFPAPRLNYFDTMEGIVRKFQAAKILPESTTEELFRLYTNITSGYHRTDHDLVSCFNDLKPENILFDGNRVWLVDWEAAFLNDRYVDLAVVANFVVRNDNEEKEYLKRYFGEEFNEYNRARFFLMRQRLHMYYFTYFLLLVSADGVPIDLNLTKPDFREFHDRMWAGKIDLGKTNSPNNDARQQYALVHMEQLLHNLRLKRFDDSLNTVSNYQLA
jgi:aminoglycoside phosphotransferase (APT) family kinase protein